MTDGFNLQPYTFHVDETVLQRIHQQIRNFRWDIVPAKADTAAGGWQAGVEPGFLRALCDYWVDGYDWRAQETALNRFPQFTADVDGSTIRFYHVRGSGDKGRPALLLSHGWPGSAFEFDELIEPLTHPERFGGNAADGFDVVVPCLPGFGFSGRPSAPVGPRAIARQFAKLMTEVLGYDRYIAQGGDWGSVISAWMGYDDAIERGGGCCGVHLNMVTVQPALPPAEGEEQAWARIMGQQQATEGAYSHMQGTRPQTLTYALMDNPVGIAAWIAEKFAVWSDLPRRDNGAPDLAAGYTFDRLLTNIMFYAATDSFATATWIYYAMMQQERSRTFPPGERCETPTAVAAFPDPAFPPPPRSRIAKGYNLVQWTPMCRGGHFAAMEQPQALIDDIRAFARRFD